MAARLAPAAALACVLLGGAAPTGLAGAAATTGTPGPALVLPQPGPSTEPAAARPLPAPPAGLLAAGAAVEARMIGAIGAGRLLLGVRGRTVTLALAGLADEGAEAAPTGCLAGRAQRLIAAAAPRGSTVRVVIARAEPLHTSGWVFAPGHEGLDSINRALVAAGLARPGGASPPVEAAALAAAARGARRQGLGIWSAACLLRSAASVQRTLVRLRYLPPSAISGRWDERTGQALMAFQGWERLARDGLAGPKTRARLLHAAVPRPTAGVMNGIEVHLDRQVLLVVSAGRVLRAVHVSTGAPGRATPHGRFHVTSRQRLSWSAPFQTWMPYALYFHGGYALHEYPDVPGWPASHGCVRMPAGEAAWVWGWARVGTEVWIG